MIKAAFGKSFLSLYSIFLYFDLSFLCLNEVYIYTFSGCADNIFIFSFILFLCMHLLLKGNNGIRKEKCFYTSSYLLHFAARGDSGIVSVSDTIFAIIVDFP